MDLKINKDLSTSNLVRIWKGSYNEEVLLSFSNELNSGYVLSSGLNYKYFDKPNMIDLLDPDYLDKLIKSGIGDQLESILVPTDLSENNNLIYKYIINDNLIYLLDLDEDVTKLELFKDNELIGTAIFEDHELEERKFFLVNSSVDEDPELAYKVHEFMKNPHINFYKEFITSLKAKSYSVENSYEVSELLLDQRSLSVSGFLSSLKLTDLLTILLLLLLWKH